MAFSNSSSIEYRRLIPFGYVIDAHYSHYVWATCGNTYLTEPLVFYMKFKTTRNDKIINTKIIIALI